MAMVILNYVLNLILEEKKLLRARNVSFLVMPKQGSLLGSGYGQSHTISKLI